MKCESCKNFIQTLDSCKFCHYEYDGLEDYCNYWKGKINKYYENENSLKEPYYYNCNGLSPIQAFEQGLVSKEEYIGFIKCNIIKYIVRCDKKEDVNKDIDKAMSYLKLLKKIMGRN